MKNGSSSCFDHMFVKNIDMHYPINAQINFVNEIIPSTKREEIFIVNEQELERILSKETWDDVYESNDVNAATKNFHK